MRDAERAKAKGEFRAEGEGSREALSSRGMSQAIAEAIGRKASFAGICPSGCLVGECWSFGRPVTGA